MTTPSPTRTTERPVERAVTADLLSRYDRPGPRYTSYPTAVEFHDGVTHDDYLRCLDAANALGDAPLALYAHLPFCEERCLFCGCHTIISRRKDVAEPYLELLRREIELLAARLEAPGMPSFQVADIRGGEIPAPRQGLDDGSPAEGGRGEGRADCGGGAVRRCSPP